MHELGQAYEKSLLSLTFAVHLELLYQTVLILKDIFKYFFNSLVYFLATPQLARSQFPDEELNSGHSRESPES